MERAFMHLAPSTHGVTGKLIFIGDESSESLALVFLRIMMGEYEVPVEWAEGRATLIGKPDSTKKNLLTNRPTTMSALVYRIFARIINRKIQLWMEDQEIFGEMRNWHKTGTVGDDSLSIVTAPKEMTRA